MGAVHDWSECLHNPIAFWQFLSTWLLPCVWPWPVGLLVATHFIAWPAVRRGFPFASPRLVVGGSRW